MKNYFVTIGILLLMLFLFVSCNAENNLSTVLVKPSDFPGEWEWVGEKRELGEDVFTETQQSYRWIAQRLTGSPKGEKWLINIVHLVSVNEDSTLLDKLVLKVTSSWESEDDSIYQFDFQKLDDSNAYWTCGVEETILSSCEVLVHYPGFVSTVAFYFPTGSEPDFVESMIESVVFEIEERARKVTVLAN